MTARRVDDRIELYFGADETKISDAGTVRHDLSIAAALELHRTLAARLMGVGSLDGVKVRGWG